MMAKNMGVSVFVVVTVFAVVMLCVVGSSSSDDREAVVLAEVDVISDDSNEVVKESKIDQYFTPLSKGFYSELERRKLEICSCTPCCYICPFVMLCVLGSSSSDREAVALAEVNVISEENKVVKESKIDQYFTPLSKSFYSELERRKLDVCRRRCFPCCSCPCKTT
nr:hypothetical protein Iba_chr04dCG7650 [Ipomoea batatas]